jgi:hypothetical protein
LGRWLGAPSRAGALRGRAADAGRLPALPDLAASPPDPIASVGLRGGAVEAHRHPMEVTQGTLSRGMLAVRADASGREAEWHDQAGCRWSAARTEGNIMAVDQAPGQAGKAQAAISRVLVAVTQPGGKDADWEKVRAVGAIIGAAAVIHGSKPARCVTSTPPPPGWQLVQRQRHALRRDIPGHRKRLRTNDRDLRGRAMPVRLPGPMLRAHTPGQADGCPDRRSTS